MKFFGVTALLFTICATNSFGAVNSESTTNISNFELNRTNKMYNLALKGGNISGGIPGYGIDVAYYTNPNLLIGLEYLQGKDDRKDELHTSLYANIDKVQLESKIFGIYGKYFTGPTFALTGGFYQRSITGIVKVSSSTDSNDFISTSSNGVATVAKIGVGNYWSWNFGLTLGCEWIGAQVPIANQNEKSSISYGTNTSKSNKNELLGLVENLSKDFSSSTSYSLLNLHLGYNF